MDQEKRKKREEKRDIKKDGNRSRRRHLQRQLEEDPENAHYDEFEFNEHNTSTKLNGLDSDNKRKQQEEWERQQYGLDNMEEEERY